jgi:hypothetical protein
MIFPYELTLLNTLKEFWAEVIAKIGTSEDLIPDIFASLPEISDGGSDWKSIRENFKRMAVGNPGDDVSFLLQFPTIKAHIPAITVEVGTEREDTVIGNFIENDYNDATQKWQTHEGSVWTKTFSLGVFAYQPDTTLYLYSLVKYGLLILRHLEDQASTLQISARPMQVLTQYGADPVYGRYLDIIVEGILDSAVDYNGKIVRINVTPTTP